MKRHSKKLTVILENNDNLFEGYIEGVKSKTLISSAAPTVKELLDNLRNLVKSYQQNEGISDSAWSGINADNVVFELKYNITALFRTHPYIKANIVAKRARINPTLMSQYAKGIKNPGAKQVKKIEIAIHEIGKELSNLQLAN